MQSRVGALEEGKDPGATTFKTNHVRALPLRLIQFLLMFVVLGIGVSILSMHTIRYFGVQRVAPTAPSTIRPCFAEPNNLESWIRAPSSLLHSMNDTELLWLASLTPQVKEYPFKRVPKIAFMFLTKGPLPMEPLWERFFKGHEGLYSIYVHSLPSYSPNYAASSVFYKRQIPSKVSQVTSSYLLLLIAPGCMRSFSKMNQIFVYDITLINFLVWGVRKSMSEKNNQQKKKNS